MKTPDKAPPTKRRDKALTPEGRANIAARQRARWAALKAKKTPAAPAVKLAATGVDSPRSLAKSNGNGHSSQPIRQAQGAAGSALTRAMKAQAPGRLKASAAAAAHDGGPDVFLRVDPQFVTRSPFNREYFDPQKLEELTENVRKKGIIEPLIVRAVKEGEWFVEEDTIGGKERWQVICFSFVDHTTRRGLLFRGEDVIPLPEADEIARRHGHPNAESFVRALEKDQAGTREESQG